MGNAVYLEKMEETGAKGANRTKKGNCTNILKTEKIRKDKKKACGKTYLS